MFFFPSPLSRYKKIRFLQYFFFFFLSSRLFYWKLFEVHITRFIKILTGLPLLLVSYGCAVGLQESSSQKLRHGIKWCRLQLEYTVVYSCAQTQLACFNGKHFILLQNRSLFPHWWWSLPYLASRSCLERSIFHILTSLIYPEKNIHPKQWPDQLLVMVQDPVNSLESHQFASDKYDKKLCLFTMQRTKTLLLHGQGCTVRFAACKAVEEEHLCLQVLLLLCLVGSSRCRAVGTVHSAKWDVW